MSHQKLETMKHLLDIIVNIGTIQIVPANENENISDSSVRVETEDVNKAKSYLSAAETILSPKKITMTEKSMCNFLGLDEAVEGLRDVTPADEMITTTDKPTEMETQDNNTKTLRGSMMGSKASGRHD